MREAGILLMGLILGGLFGYYMGYGQALNQAAPGQEEIDKHVSELLEDMGEIVGVWQGADPGFTREFRDDGVVIDRHAGSPDDESRWMLSTKDIPDRSFAGEYEDGVEYLGIVKPNAEPSYYKITKLEPSSLEMISLEKGTSLTLTRK